MIFFVLGCSKLSSELCSEYGKFSIPMILDVLSKTDGEALVSKCRIYLHAIFISINLRKVQRQILLSQHFNYYFI